MAFQQVPLSVKIAPCSTRAAMVKLVDTTGLGPVGGNSVEVRVLFAAPILGLKNPSLCWLPDGHLALKQADIHAPQKRHPQQNFIPQAGDDDSADVVGLNPT